VKRVRIVNSTGLDTRLWDMDTGEEIRHITSISITQRPGEPALVHYTQLAEAHLDMVALGAAT